MLAFSVILWTVAGSLASVTNPENVGNIVFLVTGLVLFLGLGLWLYVGGRTLGDRVPPISVEVGSLGLTYRFPSGAVETWPWPPRFRKWRMFEFETHVTPSDEVPIAGPFGLTISHIWRSWTDQLPLPDAACDAIVEEAQSAGLVTERRPLPFTDVKVYRADIHR